MFQDNLRALAQSDFGRNFHANTDGHIAPIDRDGRMWRLLCDLTGTATPRLTAVIDGIQRLLDKTDLSALTPDERVGLYQNMTYLQMEAFYQPGSRGLTQVQKILTRLDSIMSVAKMALPTAFRRSEEGGGGGGGGGKDVAETDTWKEYVGKIAPEWLTNAATTASTSASSYLSGLYQSAITAVTAPAAAAAAAAAPTRDAIFAQIEKGLVPLEAIAGFPKGEQPSLRCQALQVALRYNNNAAAIALAEQFLREGVPASRNLHLLLLATYLRTQDRSILTSLLAKVPDVFVGVPSDFYRGTKVASPDDVALGFPYGNLGACYMPAAPGDQRILAGSLLMRILDHALANEEMRASIAGQLEFHPDVRMRSFLLQDAWLHGAPALARTLMSEDLIPTLSLLLNRRADAKYAEETLTEVKHAIIASLSPQEAMMLLARRLELHAILYNTNGQLPSAHQLALLRALIQQTYGGRRTFREDTPFARALNRVLYS